MIRISFAVVIYGGASSRRLGLLIVSQLTRHNAFFFRLYLQQAPNHTVSTIKAEKDNLFPSVTVYSVFSRLRMRYERQIHTIFNDDEDVGLEMTKKMMTTSITQKKRNGKIERLARKVDETK